MKQRYFIKEFSSGGSGLKGLVFGLGVGEWNKVQPISDHFILTTAL